MSKIRYQNEKMKRRYFDWSQGALGYADKTMKVKETALWKFDEFHKYQDYKMFNAETAKRFIKYLETYKTKQGNTLDVRTRYHSVKHVKDFFTWLATQSGYKSKIHLDDVAYLRLSKADTRIATSIKPVKSPSLEYIQKLCSFEVKDEIDMRDRALIAFTALSAMRDLAIVTLPIGCFEAKELLVKQEPDKGVKTKFSKLIHSTLFVFDADLLKYVLEWQTYITKELLFDNTDPLFPATNIELESETQHTFIAKGVSKEFWASAEPMRKVFRKRAKQQGLEYYKPHSFRHFATAQALKSATNAEQMKAISQNVGHSKLATTFYGYGSIDNYRLPSIIKDMKFTDDSK
jgi:integrase